MFQLTSETLNQQAGFFHLKCLHVSNRSNLFAMLLYDYIGSLFVLIDVLCLCCIFSMDPEAKERALVD